MNVVISDMLQRKDRYFDLLVQVFLWYADIITNR